MDGNKLLKLENGSNVMDFSFDPFDPRRIAIGNYGCGMCMGVASQQGSVYVGAGPAVMYLLLLMQDWTIP